jgi:hypothetical protein
MNYFIELIKRISSIVDHINDKINMDHVKLSPENYLEWLYVECKLFSNDLTDIRKFKNQLNDVWDVPMEIIPLIPILFQVLHAHMLHSDSVMHKLLAASIMTALISMPIYPRIKMHDEAILATFNFTLKQYSKFDQKNLNSKCRSSHVELWLTLLLGELKVSIFQNSLCQTWDSTKIMVETLLTLVMSTNDNFISRSCYDVLRIMPYSGSYDPNYIFVCIFLNLSNVVIIPDKSTTKIIDKEKFRNHAFNFIKHMVGTNNEATFMIISLIRHLCIKEYNRSDLRVIIKESVLALIRFTSPYDQLCLIFFLKNISESSEYSHRILALELSQILFSLCRIPNFNGPHHTSIQEYYRLRTMYMIPILKLCFDKISQVRAKAIQKLVSVIEQFISEANPSKCLHIIAVPI